ncbi:uncharacterized protein A4U43_C04F13060 [Asparagus officinalis]|uniref:Uncharacterized protein n=1 Tax=Asparagus officinalis TaxID=4686 RepID=A0A5P1F2A2_ASPOF|nr:uncharacterized protein A4U43_C04F13060 [Asparagus officinalis]
MASQRRPSKNSKSSIRYWWIPLDAQSFKPDTAFANEDVHLQSKSHAKGCKQPETKYSSTKVSTLQFVSAIASVWDCIGQPAVFQTKSSLKYSEIFPKGNIVCCSDSSTHRVTSVDGGRNQNDLSSKSCFSSSAKSNFEDLKAIKRMLCFASCNRNLNNLTVLSGSLSSVDSSRLNKVTSTGISDDPTHEYGSIITKPRLGLNDRGKLTRNVCHETEESHITEKKISLAASTLSTENNSAKEAEESSNGQNVNSVDNVFHPTNSLYTTYLLQSPPVANTNETIVISTSPCFSIPSSSSCVAVESLGEHSTCKDQASNEKHKSLVGEVVLDEDCSTRNGLSIQYKLQHVFAKNKHALAGALAGTLVSLCLFPMDTVKTVIQAQGTGQKSSCDILRTIISERGVLGLYRGIASNIASAAPISAIYTYTYESVKGVLVPSLPKFYTYESLKQLFLTSSKPNASLSTLQTLVCGGLAGSTAALFTTPFDVVKTRLQTQVPGSLVKYDGVLHALQEIAREEGLQGLYRGLTPRLAIYISQGAIFFASYEFLKAIFSLETPQAPSQVIVNKESANSAPSRLQLTS